MDEVRSSTSVSGHLPPTGAPLLAVPGASRTQKFVGCVFWLKGKRTWFAPVLPGGLVAWSRTQALTDDRHPLTGRQDTDLTAPLHKHDVLDRVRDERLLRPELLPQPGQPLVVNFDLGVAYWMRGKTLMHTPWLMPSLLLGWGSAGEVVRVDADVHERRAIDHAVRVLHEATPGGPTTVLPLPPDAFMARSVSVERWSVRTLRRPVDEPAVPLLRTGNALRDREGHVVLDRGMAVDLAAEVLTLPGAQRPECEHCVCVVHPAPDYDRDGVVLWNADGLAVLHDLRRPSALRLIAEDRQPLAEETARMLGGALVAAVERLDVLRGLAMDAWHQDGPRRERVRAEAAFAERVAAEDGGR